MLYPINTSRNVFREKRKTNTELDEKNFIEIHYYVV